MRAAEPDPGNVPGVTVYLFWERGCPHCARAQRCLRGVAAKALAGIVTLSVAVNLVELLCSAGIPAVCTQVLVMTPMPAWQHYGYLLLYITVFMPDDIAVFAVAMLTLQVTGLAGRCVRLSHLIGGFVLLAIGAILLLRPELLTFA